MRVLVGILAIVVMTSVGLPKAVAGALTYNASLGTLHPVPD